MRCVQLSRLGESRNSYPKMRCVHLIRTQSKMRHSYCAYVVIPQNATHSFITNPCNATSINLSHSVQSDPMLSTAFLKSNIYKSAFTSSHSLHVPNQPLLTHVLVAVVVLVVAAGWCAFFVLVTVEVTVTTDFSVLVGVRGGASLHPNQPGDRQVDVDVGWTCSFEVGDGVAVGVVVVMLSLHPNQPGVWHVVVGVVLGFLSFGLVVVVLVVVVVVVSSRQPHQPGVLHVEVRVVVVVVLVVDVVVVTSLWLLSKKSQLKQSVQSHIGSHTAGAVYASMTSCTTTRIL